MHVGTLDVKAVFKRIRFSRKFVLLSGIVLLLGGASGLAAVFVGKDALFGPSNASVNGLDCEMVQTVNIKKAGSLWVRKFIRTEGGDGTERVKTALRVAKSVYDKQKPDLVQVSILDQNGPTMRSDMRGRAIAAQVVYIPDLTKIPADADAKPYSAFYYDGSPSGDGVFYGLRIDLPLEDTEHLAAGLKEFTDCTDPTAQAAAGEGHGEASTGHDAPAEGHGDPGGHGEAAPAEGHDAPAPEAAHDGAPAAAAADDPGLLTSTPEHESVSMFSLAYLKSLIFGKGPTEAVAAEPAHGATPVPEEPAAHGEAAPAEEPVKPEH
ncbi:hypothetical protein RRU01S_02_00280 [Agrobacterium rubi TR3 = NBRC 13261]|uniref:Uncharacterized protein n=1 Tax=Agrobacterium rubi TR3 = NBRC 13261 TaxID=1368415 RepID=A0A081CPV4_9HYPH|nr:hypothetical protein [Agrobacterium rubi]GAK68700.1 hypothetical protein RRU01S_02_00280 [Agrobacterium rubi TR3 = NBRC 13261]